jgi:hypothetical protein
VHRSGITRRASGSTRERSSPLEALGNGAEPDRLGAVLAVVVGDLLAPGRSTDASEHRAPAIVQGSNQRGGADWTLELGQQQSARTAEPEDHRAVGVERSALPVRKPAGQTIPNRHNGRMTATGRRLATARRSATE